MVIRDLTDILVTSYPDHSPVLRFDGVGGISMSNVKISYAKIYVHMAWILAIPFRLRE